MRKYIQRLLAAVAHPERVPPYDVAFAAFSLAQIAESASDDAMACREAAEKMLDVTVACVPRMPSCLYGGYSGAAWALRRTNTLLGIGNDGDETDDIDTALIDTLSAPGWAPLGFDLISGAVGCGVYALERRDERLLQVVIDKLRSQADVRGRWLTPHGLGPEPEKADLFNFGIAHGAAGPISFLAHALRGGAKVEDFLRAAMGSLWSQAAGPNGEFSYEDLQQAPFADPGVRWCYGDLGVSAALFNAALALGDTTWRDRALQVARRVAERPLVGSGVDDPYLCHGAAGAMHIFHRFFLATREPLMQAAAARWFTIMQQLPPGEPSAKLLTGDAGAALALQAYAAGEAATWDCLLLVDFPVNMGA